jgi:biofilm PGA synthesis N-glycosyltransferase PgaC
MYRIGVRMFAEQDLKVRSNPQGFLIYAFVYSVILQPASVAGYFSELLGMRKTWGSK